MKKLKIQDEFEVLRKIDKTSQTSQRLMAKQLGFSLGKLKYCLKALKNKSGVGILPDHTPKINQGVMSNFFNVPVNTTTLIHKLSKKNKVPIIYIFSERLSRGKGFNIHVGLIDKSFYESDEGKAADLLNKTLEGLVMKNINQYQWSYERFRNRSGVKESIYN